MKRSSMAVAALVLASGGALAADLPSRAVAPLAPLPIFTWTGFYVGLNAGYGFSSDTDASLVGQAAPNIATVGAGARPASIGIEREGFIGGAQIGYNFQINQLVLGVEADIQYTDLQETVNVVTALGAGSAFPGTRNNIFNSELEYLGTVRARLGYAFDRTMVFVTGGLAYGEVSTSANLFGPLPANVLQFTGSRSDTEFGWTVGGGVEHAFTNNFSVKAEYLYYDLGNTTVAANVIAGSGGVGTGYDVTFKNTGHIARVGLNYRF